MIHWRTVAHQVTHPTQLAILKLIDGQGPTAPSQAAVKLDQSIPTVVHHFLRLERVKLIEVDTRRSGKSRPGSVTLYRLTMAAQGRGSGD